MHVLLAPLALVALLVTPEAAQSPSSLTLRFIGNEAVAISDGRQTIVTDFPYESGYAGYMTYDWASNELSGEVVSLITHQHRDHFEARLLAQTGWRVVGPSSLGVPKDRLTVPSDPVRIGNATITGIRTPHARLEHYSYLLEWNGRRMYFAGDSDSTDALTAQENLDVAFVTPWLLRAVEKEGRTINARRIVIYHHTASEQRPTCTRCVVPLQGSMIDLPMK